jgi:hypothetical protein
LSIGLISSLKRFEEVVVPSLPLELMRTGIPAAEVGAMVVRNLAARSSQEPSENYLGKSRNSLARRIERHASANAYNFVC